MPYSLTKTNGTLLTVVDDGTLNNTTDLVFVGKNYTGYGDPVNENFVKLLENFASSVPSSKPITGQLWYDLNSNQLKVYNGTAYKSLPMMNTGNNFPNQGSAGDLYFNGNLFYAYTGKSWLPIGPISNVGSANNASLPSIQVIANDQSVHSAVNLTIGDGSAAVLSTSSAYDVYSQNQAIYNQFTALYPGINLPNTDVNGISAYYDPGSAATLGNVLWGTAASSIGLVSYANSQQSLYKVTDLVTQANLASLNPININADLGLTVNSALQVHVTRSLGQPIANISNVKSNVISFNVNTLAGTYTNFVNFDGRSGTFRVMPNTSTAVTLGSADAGGSFSAGYITNLQSTSVVANSVSGLTVTAGSLTAGSASVTNNISAASATLASRSTIGGAEIVTTATQSYITLLSNNAGYITPANIGNYNVASLHGTAGQVNVSSTTGNITVSLPNLISVNTLTAAGSLSAPAIYMNGSLVLTAATFNGTGIASVLGTPNQIDVATVGSQVTLNLDPNLKVTNLDASNNLTVNGSQVLTVGAAVLTFSGGTTGLTPFGANYGNIVLGGVLTAASGGTGISPSNVFTGIPYANNSSAWTKATANQVVATIGSTPVAYATTASNAVAASTQSNTDKSTNVATTNFVHNLLPYGSIILWWGTAANVPSGWSLCDGSNGTPNLTGRFIMASSSSYPPGATGGSADATLPNHTHNINVTVTDPGHHHIDPYAEGGVPFDQVPASSGAMGSNSTDHDQSLYYTSKEVTGITVSSTADAVGASPTNANLPPFYALCYIMKITGQ